MRTDNALLLSCRSPYLDSDKTYPPLANLYLQSIINREDPSVGVEVSDEYSLQNAEWLNGFDTVGVSIMTPQREEARRLANFIRSVDPNIKLVAGGPHARHYLEEMVGEPWDVICTDDAERVMGPILRGSSERVVSDNIPVSVFEGFAVKPNRLDNGAFLRSFNYKLGERDSTTMMTGKGCPMQCTFCFRGDTRIMTKQDWKQIKDIIVGDEVFTFNEKKGIVEIGKVKKLFKRKVNKILKISCNRRTIYVTHEHPFYQYGKWVKAKDLKIGDILHVIDSKKMLGSKERYSLSKIGDKNPMKRKEVIDRANSKENYDKRRKNGFGVVKNKFNNIERKLNSILSNEWEFVGNKPIIINGYNPDFVHKEKRKIIELNGCYWHNCKEIEMFKKASYEILIRWEHELANELNLIKKIWDFETNGKEIRMITEINEETDVYNFECDNNTYFAEGVLVHNCEDAKTKVKWTPNGLIMEEIDDVAELGYKGVYLFDDIFTLNIKRMKPVVERLKANDLVYRCNGQAGHFDREDAEILARTGCYEIAFGAESGSQRILDNVRKRTTVQQNYDFVKNCKDYGIKVKAFLMIGLPGEDEGTIEDTERFIRESGVDDFQLAVYYPYKGTQIRADMDRGVGDLHFMGEGLGAYGQKGGSSESVVYTDGLSASQLLAHRDRIVRSYKPESHQNKWSDDKFFDTHLEGKIET